MPAVLDPPPKPKQHRTGNFRPNQHTWTPAQAAQARVKSIESRRRNAIERKKTQITIAQVAKQICESDPVTDLERGIALAVKRGHSATADRLASALVKVKRANSIASPTSDRVSHKISYVQYAKPVPQPLTSKHNIEIEVDTTGGVRSKESLNPGPVGAGCPGGTAAGQATPPAIASFTPRSDPTLPFTPTVNLELASLREEVFRLRQEVARLKGQSAVPMAKTGTPELPPGCPGPGYEKVRISGVWVWARRNR